MKYLYFRRDGTPYPFGPKGLEEWAKDFEDLNVKRVALTLMPNGIEVSTVWLGLDHNYLGKGRPLIFETMSFSPCHKEINFFGHKKHLLRDEIGETWRYATEEEAIRGHKMMVKKWSIFKTADQVLRGEAGSAGGDSGGKK